MGLTFSPDLNITSEGELLPDGHKDLTTAEHRQWVKYTRYGEKCWIYGEKLMLWLKIPVILQPEHFREIWLLLFFSSAFQIKQIFLCPSSSNVTGEQYNEWIWATHASFMNLRASQSAFSAVASLPLPSCHSRRESRAKYSSLLLSQILFCFDSCALFSPALPSPVWK